MMLECIADQMGTTADSIPPIKSKISIFHSAVAMYFSPSDPSGRHGMRRERIRSTPSWRGHEKRRDCAFVIEDDLKPGIAGISIVRVMLFFSFEYDGVFYPCALVEWFTKIALEPVMGLWVIRPDITRGKRDRTVLHLDAFLRGAHLIPVYGSQKLPIDFHYSYSLDAFEAYYVNKYIDHHANEAVF